MIPPLVSSFQHVITFERNRICLKFIHFSVSHSVVSLAWFFPFSAVCSVRFFYLVILNWMTFILFTKMRVHIIELVFVWLAYGILVSADLTPSTEQSTPSVDVTSIKKVLSSHPEWFLDYFSTLTSNSIIFWLAEHCNILWITVSGQHRLYDESIGSIVWLIQKLYQHSVRTIWKSWSEYLSILT